MKKCIVCKGTDIKLIETLLSGKKIFQCGNCSHTFEAGLDTEGKINSITFTDFREIDVIHCPLCETLMEKMPDSGWQLIEQRVYKCPECQKCIEIIIYENLPELKSNGKEYKITVKPLLEV